ncbi:MAG: sensor histidine kinase, partial [Gemmatimonadales bacterium]
EIAILSELALADGHDRDRLARIGEKSRATLASIGEIVWAIDPRNDDGDRFIAYLREFVSEFVDAAGLEATLDFPAPGALAASGADFRRTVLMIVKEALANVTKHAEARSVSITLTVGQGMLHLEIADDGRGTGTVTRSGVDAGNGLRNMRSRAEEAGGRVAVHSAPGQGTRIVLELPVAPVRSPHGEMP